jgi:RNA polymerase sigma-70 factor (ECF subfamily)
LEALIDCYQLRAVRAAFLITGDRQEAEDIVIEAFYRAWEHIDQFDDALPFAPWFFTLVMNAARRSAERSARFVDQLDADPEDVADFIPNNPNPEEILIRAESQEEVRQALARLPIKQRIAIVQQYFLDWTVEEIANQADRPSGTIKWRLSQARKRLRDWLGQFHEERIISDLARRKE